MIVPKAAKPTTGEAATSAPETAPTRKPRNAADQDMPVRKRAEDEQSSEVKEYPIDAGPATERVEPEKPPEG